MVVAASVLSLLTAEPAPPLAPPPPAVLGISGDLKAARTARLWGTPAPAQAPDIQNHTSHESLGKGSQGNPIR